MQHKEISILIATLAVATFLGAMAVTPAEAVPAPPLPPLPNVNVQINGYLPPPPGVNVYRDEGRPYYIEHGHRVYLEKDPKHHKKHKHKHDNGRGKKKGHHKHH